MDPVAGAGGGNLWDTLDRLLHAFEDRRYHGARGMPSSSRD